MVLLCSPTFHATFAGISSFVDTSSEPSRKNKPKKSTSNKLVKKITTQRPRKVLEDYIADMPLPDAKLFAFPSFDRSDALIYFASTYSRLKNSGDTLTMSKLLLNRCAKNCTVMLSHNANDSVSAARYLELSDITDILHPDSVCCMHSTKVIGNQIKSIIYFKFTDIPAMHEHANLIVSDPLFRSFFVGKRKDVLKKRFGMSCGMQQGDRARVYELVESEEEFQVYGHCEFNLTIDEHTKKIVSMQYLTSLDSVGHDGKQYIL